MKLTFAGGISTLTLASYEQGVVHTPQLHTHSNKHFGYIQLWLIIVHITLLQKLPWAGRMHNSHIRKPILLNFDEQVYHIKYIASNYNTERESAEWFSFIKRYIYICHYFKTYYLRPIPKP